jgi:hypothetical protein
MENEVSILLNAVTQQQSKYESCSVSNVPTAEIFVEQASYFVIEGTGNTRGNITQMVQQSVNHAI